MIRDGLGRLAVRVSGVLGLAIGLAVFLPATVAAHTLNATYTSRLPLAVYLVGAATTVALSFIFVIVRDVRAAPPVLDAEGSLPPAWLRYTLRALGLIGWIWIIAQGIAGNSSDADVATLFLWVYGWVGLAIICALVGPAWHFIDPFSTLHDIGAWVLQPARRPGLGDRRLPGASRSLAGRHRLRVLRLARARHLRRRLDAVHRAGRVHRADRGDDGPVRARRMAVARRDLHRLVPDPRPPRPLAIGRRGGAGPSPSLRERPARAGLVGGRRDAGGLRRVVDHLRRAVTDRELLQPVRRSRHPRAHGDPVRVHGHRRRARVRGGSDGRPRRDRSGVAADRRRLPDRPLPDLPADRRATHPDRHLRPAPARGQPVRHRVPHAERRLAAAGSGLDDPAGGRRRRAHARGVGRTRRRGRGRPGRDEHRSVAPATGPAGGRHGRPDHA